MKFQENDSIIVTATGERGKVIEWIDKLMVLIEVDSVQFPVYADQIDFPYFQDFTSKKDQPTPVNKTITIPRSEKNIKKLPELDGVWLSFFPILDKDVFDDDIISHFRIYLLNHTEDDLIFELSIYYGTTKEIDLKHTIKSLDEMYLFEKKIKLNDPFPIEIG